MYVNPVILSYLYRLHAYLLLILIAFNGVSVAEAQGCTGTVNYSTPSLPSQVNVVAADMSGLPLESVKFSAVTDINTISSGKTNSNGFFTLTNTNQAKAIIVQRSSYTIKSVRFSNDRTRMYVNLAPCITSGYHSADTNQDWSIGLSELMRVIQLFNARGYHCEPTTPDGYAPYSSFSIPLCDPHDADYSGAASDSRGDFVISTSELLRVIQLYHGAGYTLHPTSEDGFTPGVF